MVWARHTLCLPNFPWAWLPSPSPSAVTQLLERGVLVTVTTALSDFWADQLALRERTIVTKVTLQSSEHVGRIQLHREDHQLTLSQQGDAYLHNGNVGFFEMHKWEHLYSLLGEDGLTHDKAAAQAYYTAQYSIENNP